MEKLLTKIDKFLALFTELQAERELALKEQSDIDKELTSLYHEVEGTRFMHVCDSHKMLMKIQKTLAKRRNIKGKVAVLLSLTDNLKGHMNNTKATFINTLKKHNEIMSQFESEIKRHEAERQARIKSSPKPSPQVVINFSTEMA